MLIHINYMKRHISSYFLFLCILISSAGCSGDNERNHFQEEISFSELKTEQLLKAPMIRNPKSIQMVRDRLIIAEAGGTPVLHFFEVTESGKDAVKYIRSTGREGRGPGEFIRPMEIVPADSIFYVYDGSNFKMTAFSLEGELMDEKSITLSTRGLPNSIFMLNDMRLLLAGMFMHERFQVISMKDSTVNSYGEYPVFDDRFTPRDNGIAWLSHAALSSDDRYVYLFAENAEYVEKYTMDGKRIKRIQGNEYPVPDMKDGLLIRMVL